MTTQDISHLKMYYRIRHPEFDPGVAHLALLFHNYGESSWDYITFVNCRGMTYSVRNDHCHCLGRLFCRESGEPGGLITGYFGLDQRHNISPSDPIAPLCVAIAEDQARTLEADGWPKPRGKNPDLDNDR